VAGVLLAAKPGTPIGVLVLRLEPSVAGVLLKAKPGSQLS